MSLLDYELSVKVAGLIHAQKYHCWYNARDALVHLPGLFLFARYVEGWLVEPMEHEVQIIEHGWVEFADGRIVDPSIVLLAGRDQDLHYFSGLLLGWPDVQDIPQDAPLPLARLISHRKDGLGHPDYKAAYETASAHAEGLANASGKLVRVCLRETTLVVMGKEGTLIITLEE